MSWTISSNIPMGFSSQGASTGDVLPSAPPLASETSYGCDPRYPQMIDPNQRLYVTYTKTHELTGEVYTGRTSGFGNPHDIVAERDRYHHASEFGLGKAITDTYSHEYAAIRGREQQMIERHGGPQVYGGDSGNRYSGISDSNRNKEYYKERGTAVFGRNQTFSW